MSVRDGRFCDLSLRSRAWREHGVAKVCVAACVCTWMRVGCCVWGVAKAWRVQGVGMGWAAASVFVGIRVSLSVREGQGSCTCVSDGRLSYLLACSARGEDKAFGVCRCRCFQMFLLGFVLRVACVGGERS